MVEHRFECFMLIVHKTAADLLRRIRFKPFGLQCRGKLSCYRPLLLCIFGQCRGKVCSECLCHRRVERQYGDKQGDTK